MVMVRVQERILWPEFSHLQTALELYFKETVDHLITGRCDDSTPEAPRIGS
jgi:hypothetical protein